MRVEYLRAHYALLFCRNVNQPENTAVWCAIDNREFSEILVQRDKNTFFGIGSGENILVSGIFLPVAHPNGVMPGDLQIRNRPAPPQTQASRRSFIHHSSPRTVLLVHVRLGAGRK